MMVSAGAGIQRQQQRQFSNVLLGPRTQDSSHFSNVAMQMVEWCAGLNCPQQGSTSDQTNVPEITLPALLRAQSGLRTAFNICQIVDIAYLFWQSRILRQNVTSALLPFQLIFSHNFCIVRRSALQKQHICGILLCNLKF